MRTIGRYDPCYCHQAMCPYKITQLASPLLHVWQSSLPQGATATFSLTHATLVLHCNYHPHLLEIVELVTLLWLHMPGQQMRGRCHITPRLQPVFRTHTLPHLSTGDMLLWVGRFLFAMDVSRAARFVVLSAPGQTEAPSSRHIGQERQRPDSAPDRHNIIHLEHTHHILCVLGASLGTCSCWLKELPL